ncbi:MAG: transcriptional repressor [Gemmatimonadales bacterium]|nr:transcriptional repressor [Gemmatimonadales bacterium]
MIERNTRQRDAIRLAFQTAGRPLNAQEAHDLAARTVTGIGIATIYRNIKTFVDEGELAVVELPGEPPRYEVTGLAHHHHFRCSACDKVFDIPGCPGKLQSLLPAGYQLDSHEVYFRGRCPSCAD